MVSLNVHCADHRNHEAYTIQNFLQLPGDSFHVPGNMPNSVRQLSRATYDPVRVKVIDTKSPAQPSDLSVSTAYAGTLTADVGGGNAFTWNAYDGIRSWFFNVAYNWDTTGATPPGTRSDVLDATRRFSAFKIRIEGDDSLSPSIPTYVTERWPGFHRAVSAGDTRNTAPYQVGHFTSGLPVSADPNTNPGDPVYRFTFTPVTIRNVEVPGETVTACFQLQSPVATRLARKVAVKVDCSLFNPPTGEVEVVGLDYQMAQLGESTPPTLTIAGDAFGVTEGGDVTYTITANPPPAEEIYLEVAIKEQMGSGGDAASRQGSEVLLIPAGASSVEWTVTAYSDDVERDDGTIVAELVAGEGYTLGDPSSVSMTLLDDDAPKPEISVTGGGGITEGGDASFTVSASPAPSTSLDVKVTVTQSGDYGATTGQRTVTIPTMGSATFTVDTTDDQADETDGSVTATVDVGSGYAVSSSQGAATVSVADNDNAPTPVVSVTGGGGITEGGSASFTVSASSAPSAHLDVKVTVTQSGDYGATTGPRTVTIPTSGSVTFTVGATDDQADETDGSVTATVDAGTGYTVSSSQGAATVSVADNDDAPRISVIVEDASATEGGILPFRVRLSAASTEEIKVRWYTAPAYDRPDDRAHTSDYQASEGELVFPPGVTDLTAEVWLEQDDEDEPDEYFSVEAFLPGSLFMPDAVGTMTIVDDD